MAFSLTQWGQILTLLMIAIALGMDAFSLGIGLGIQRLSLRKIVWLSVAIGLFHIGMPLIGMALGQMLGRVMKEIATLVGGGMLCFLGANILFQLFRAEKKENNFNVHSWWGSLLFAMSVSLDSLSAGFSLGLFAVDQLLALSLFGVIGMLMAGSGLYIGRYVGKWLGNYGEALSGIILLVLGSKFLW